MARMADKKKAKKLKTLNIPGMRDVEGKRPLAPEGTYEIAVKEITLEESDNGEYYKWVFEKAGGKGKGALVYHNTSLQPQALWNLRSILESLGIDPPDDDEEMDIEDFIGKSLMATISHEKKEGYSTQARIVDHEPTEGSGEEEEAEEDDDDKEAKKRAARKARRAARAGKKNDDGDDDEKPKGKKAGKKKPKSEPELDADTIGGMDEDELAEVVSEHELDVELDEYATLKKKKAAVIDAATEAGLIEE